MFLDHLRPAVALVTLCLIFVQGSAHQAQQLPSTPPVAQASLARTAPVLNGRVLDDPARQDVSALVEFWQTAPDAGQPSSERTEVRIVYTESAIYFGVVLLDRDPSGLTTSDSATRRSTTPTAFASSSTRIETGRTGSSSRRPHRGSSTTAS